MHSLFSPAPCLLCLGFTSSSARLSGKLIISFDACGADAGSSLYCPPPQAAIPCSPLYSLTLPYDRVPRSNRPRASLMHSSRMRMLVLGLETLPISEAQLALATITWYRWGERKKPWFVPQKLVDKRVTNIPVGRLHSSELLSPLTAHR